MKLEDLGFTQQELQDRVINMIAEDVMAQSFTGYDYDSDEEYSEKRETPFARRLKDLVVARVDAQIAAIAEQHILPKVSDYVENLTLQETNRWGEKTGQKVTFIEYLVKRAENYLTEGVNYEGKAQNECSSGYGWNKTQSRLTHLVHQHLHYSIATAMKQAIADANAHIVKGLEETTKIKLAEIAASLKVEVKHK
jgi:isocitrate lyase